MSWVEIRDKALIANLKALGMAKLDSNLGWLKKEFIVD
ncbi:hypothetical protein I602_2010 [Polaribacter dokdonensis DSW-5]|uniref:Uncharacterized protein n=1 Tax=Polaribacter dokdonensis DSW-5 TaxID=1300348 RepID=A0A0N0CFV8_9FLAO|nr:hypothetical protein I602_2010 [Polaribacter dokdonensis DSW-5]